VVAIRAVVFDFGSVLSRTDRDYIGAFERDYGLTREQWRPLFAGPRAVEYHVGERFDRASVERYLSAELAEFCGERSAGAARRLAGVFDDVRSQVPNVELIELLTRLRAADVPVGILSNGPVESLEMFRVLLGEALPKVVVLSGTHGVRKPNRDAFEAVSGELGVALSECFFIDDQEALVEAARELGMGGHRFRGDVPKLEAELKAAGLRF
jgi:putative hydrolase of the HAD superfamily